MGFGDLLEGKSVLFVVVVGDADAINPLGFDLPKHLVHHLHTGRHTPGGLPNIPGRGFPQLSRLGTPDANTIRIRGLKQELKNQSVLGLLTVLLNSVDTPLRCVIDEKIIYFVPESATVNLRGGKTARPEYEENWVEIGEKKGG